MSPVSRARIPRRGGFTLIELLVVIAIIGILAGLLMAGVSRAYWNARLAQCKNNVKQFGTAIKIYSNDWDDEIPFWLSNLYKSYVNNEKMYVCPADTTKGKEGCKPPWQTGESTEQFTELDDFKGSGASGEDAEAAALMNPDIEANSYLYEFSCARCSWWSGPTEEVVRPGEKVTWRKVKEYEAKTWSHVPMISCFYHTSGTFGQHDVVIRLGYETHDIYTSDTTADGWKTASGH